MTKHEYEQYQKAVADFFEREGIRNLSSDSEVETFFSWKRCDCCLRPEAGDRAFASGYNPKTEEVQDEYEVCFDCVYYAEYGQLDDDTMWEINHESV